RVHRRFERRDRRISERQRFKVPGKLRPACEPVPARDEELRGGQSTPRSAFIRLLELVPLMFHPFRFEVDLSSDFWSDLQALQPGNRFRPASRPVADFAGRVRLAGALEIFCELLVLFEVGKRRKRESGRHTNLLSLNAWWPHVTG